MPTDPLTGSRYPASSAAPNVAQDIQNAVMDLADNAIPRFATTAARDAAYATAGVVLANGQMCWCDTPGSWYLRSGGVWNPFAYPPVLTTLTTASGWSTPAGHGQQVYQDASGLVHLTGWVQNDSQFIPSGTQTILTIPTAFRPARQHNFIIPMLQTANVVVVSARTDGTVVTETATAVVQVAQYFDLSVIQYHPTSTA